PPQWRRGFVAVGGAEAEDFLRGGGELLRGCPLGGACLTEASDFLPELLGGGCLTGVRKKLPEHLRRNDPAKPTTLERGTYGIGDEGAVALAGSLWLANLTWDELGTDEFWDELGTDEFWDEVVVALTGSTHLANLATLNLSHNGIGAKGAKALASSPHLANLT